MTKSDRDKLCMALAKLLSFEAIMGKTEVPASALNKYIEASAYLWDMLNLSSRTPHDGVQDVYELWIEIESDPDPKSTDHPLDK